MKKGIYEKLKGLDDGKVPIRKGCPNKICYCTGDCQEIISYRDKYPDEL